MAPGTPTSAEPTTRIPGGPGAIDNEDDSQAAGISAGGVAGIAIGAVAMIALAAAVGVLLLCRPVCCGGGAKGKVNNANNGKEMSSASSAHPARQAWSTDPESQSVSTTRSRSDTTTSSGTGTDTSS